MTASGTVTASGTTAGTADKATDAIAALLQERRRYEGWLTALEVRRATTPPHVYARVHDDYEGRLSAVLEQLGGRSAELQRTVDELAAVVAALQADEDTKRDERAEAELRSAVGEYTAERWEDLSRTADAEIARIASKRGEASTELAQLQQLLYMASAKRPAPADKGSDKSGAPKFDELAFLESVVEPKPDMKQPARPSEPKTGPKVTPKPSEIRSKTPASPPFVVPQAPASVAAAAPAPVSEAMAAREPAVALQTPPDSAPVNNVGAAEKRTDPMGRKQSQTDAVPVFLRDVPAEQAKTLRCAECGTMNYPTEWYCERCGGELAAM